MKIIGMFSSLCLPYVASLFLADDRNVDVAGRHLL